MSDKQDKPDAQESGEAGPKGGERLAEARRAQQISVLDVAKELHLDEPKVRALESNDFDMLGAPVFAKGHLRKYAQLVGVDEADVFADYYAMTRASAAPPLIVGRKKIPREFSPGPWIAVIVILLAAAGGYWWFVEREVAPSPQPDEVLPDTIQPEQLSPEQLQPDEVVSPDEGVSAVEDAAADDDTVNEEPIVLAAASETATATQPAVTQALPAGQIRLALTFSGDCWTEVTDADGRRLFVNMGRAGQSLDLSGKAPLSVLFGNADNVSVRVNGNAYALPAPAGANRMVRTAILSQ